MISHDNEKDSKSLNQDLLDSVSFIHGPSYKDFILRCSRLGIPSEDASKMLTVQKVSKEF